MKTPREILLERHRPMESKLDAVRRRVLAVAKEPESPAPGGFLLTLWQELVWPCRRVWCGLAGAWLVIVAVNLATSEPSTMAIAQGPPPTPDTMAALKEQQQLMVQLLDGAADVPAVPRPRSEQRERAAIG